MTRPSNGGWLRRLSSDAGSALIETAMVSPLLLMMVFGVIQFGVVMHTNIGLNDAVRVGSRSLAMMRGTTDPCTTAATKLRSAATGMNLSNLMLTITVNGTAYGPANIPACSGAGTAMVSGADATVRATYPCNAVIYGVNYIPNCTLSAQTTVRVE